jgi:tetratricopeptide (TPR) repeat protein
MKHNVSALVRALTPHTMLRSMLIGFDTHCCWLAYSNRSAALLKLNKVAKALSDAEAAIQREPEWDKGYFRKAAALEAQDKLEEVLPLSNLVDFTDAGLSMDSIYTARHATSLINMKSVSRVQEGCGSGGCASQAAQHYRQAAQLNPSNAEVAAKVKSLDRQLGLAPVRVSTDGTLFASTTCIVGCLMCTWTTEHASSSS